MYSEKYMYNYIVVFTVWKTHSAEKLRLEHSSIFFFLKWAQLCK